MGGCEGGNMYCMPSRCQHFGGQQHHAKVRQRNTEQRKTCLFNPNISEHKSINAGSLLNGACVRNGHNHMPWRSLKGENEVRNEDWEDRARGEWTIL